MYVDICNILLLFGGFLISCITHKITPSYPRITSPLSYSIMKNVYEKYRNSKHSYPSNDWKINKHLLMINEKLNYDRIFPLEKVLIICV